MEQLLTANQRDINQALQNAAIIFVVALICSFSTLIMFETLIFSAFHIIVINSKPVQIFGSYISHALNSEAIFNVFHINNFTYVELREVFNESLILKISEYLIYFVSTLISLLISINEYSQQMKNERFISGVRYFKNLGEAKKELAKYQRADVKKTGEGVKVADVPISRDRETKHFAVIGKTGGGKTVALLPIMREAINRGDKVILFDNKGDFTRIINDKDGKQPVIVAPWDARSAAWDVARDCRTKAEAAELAARFIGESGGDPMWSEGARQILTGLIHKLQRDKQEGWSWGDLAELLYIDMKDVEKVMEHYHPEGKRAVESLKKEDDESGAAGETSKTTQSLLITLSAQLSPVYRMAEAWADVEEKFSVRDFLAGKLKSNVVILQGNASLLGIQNAYIQGIIAMLSSRVNSPDYEERPASAEGLWLFLDEFPQLGKLPEVKPFLEIGRSKGVRVVMGFQNPSQLKELYDKDGSDSMLDIFQSYIFCMLGSEASKWASDSIGKKIIERFKYSTSQNFGASGSASSSWERSEEPACKPNDFTQGLGVDSKAGGTWALYWPTGGDVYKLLFKFSDARKLRESSVKASWVSPAWDNGGAIQIDEIQKKIKAVSNDLRKFLSTDALEKPVLSLTVKQVDEHQKQQIFKTDSEIKAFNELEEKGLKGETKGAFEDELSESMESQDALDSIADSLLDDTFTALEALNKASDSSKADKTKVALNTNFHRSSEEEIEQR